MTPRTPQCEVFFPLLLSSEHSGVPEDSNSQLFQVLGFTPTLGQSRGATLIVDVEEEEEKENFFKKTRSKKEIFFSFLHAIVAEFMDVDRFATPSLAQLLSIPFCLTSITISSDVRPFDPFCPSTSFCYHSSPSTHRILQTVCCVKIL
jgi:hypothetical protein